jgi:hypothetical protein
VKRLAIILIVLSLCLSGSPAFAVDPGTYNFGGTISIESVFATGGTGQHAADGRGYFCIQGLVVGEPDGNGVQTITGSDNPVINYGVFITGVRLAIVECIQLDPIGQITGYIDNNGNNAPATVTTSGINCERLQNYECEWATWIDVPTGPAGTVVMTIPLHSSVLQDPPPWVTYGDPAATSLTAIAEMQNGRYPGGEYQHTLDFRYGIPLQGSSLNIVSPDVHFREVGGLLIEDVLSWTRFDGIFSQGPCPAQKPDWQGCSTIEPTCEASHIFNYLLIVLLPALFICIGVIGRRR